jgi:glycosyltransferase involved in cell wall biosynthesis
MTSMLPIPNAIKTKQGWLWTDEIEDPPKVTGLLPKISVVTPSYNQGDFLEETIRSVLLQNYPNLEYIIMDGGSTDNSVDVIRYYEPWLASWISQKDKGQANAINAGFSRSTGDLLCWLNSDDTFTPNALWWIAQAFNNHQDAQVVYGNSALIDQDSRLIRELHDVPFNKWAYVMGGINLHQAAVSWRKDLFFQLGGLSEELVDAIDGDLFIRYAMSGARFVYIRKILAGFRKHPLSKTVLSNNHTREVMYAKRYYVKEPSIYYTLGHNLFQVRRLFWLVCQGDLKYVLNGFFYRLNLRQVTNL